MPIDWRSVGILRFWWPNFPANSKRLKMLRIPFICGVLKKHHLNVLKMFSEKQKTFL